MAFLKEFGQRLAELKERQETERLAEKKKARDEEVARTETERLAELAEETWKREFPQRQELLRGEIEGTFRPILEVVNENYLNGEGDLELKEEEPERGYEAKAALLLSWNKRETGKDYDAIIISKSLGSNTAYLKCGGIGGLKEEFDMQKENWREQLVDAIETALREGRCKIIPITGVPFEREPLSF